jgi:Flp pilus assembly protein TadG
MANSLLPKIRRPAGLAAGWLSSSKGNVALLFALLTPMLIGGAGLATEVGVWYHRRLELQSAADSAAYAAAVALRAGSTPVVFTQEALTAAKASGYDPDQGTLTVNNPPQSGTHTSNQAIEVLISENVPRFFSSIFINTPLVEHTRSVTQFQNASNACVLALDPSAASAALFSGSSNVTLTGCSVMANSVSPTAILSQGAQILTTDCIISVGGVSLTGGVIGNGVTIYMSGSSAVTMNGNATVNLSAPTSGTYQGMLMMGDRTCTTCSTTSEQLNGTAASLMTGAIYFPKQNVNYIGNFAGANGCTQIVSDTVTWNGHTHLAANCTGYGMRNLAAYEAVRFVE